MEKNTKTILEVKDFPMLQQKEVVEAHFFLKSDLVKSHKLNIFHDKKIYCMKDFDIMSIRCFETRRASVDDYYKFCHFDS